MGLGRVIWRKGSEEQEFAEVERGRARMEWRRLSASLALGVDHPLSHSGVLKVCYFPLVHLDRDEDVNEH